LFSGTSSPTSFGLELGASTSDTGTVGILAMTVDVSGDCLESFCGKSSLSGRHGVIPLVSWLVSRQVQALTGPESGWGDLPSALSHPQMQSHQEADSQVRSCQDLNCR
jgi:hypothetical protein